MSGAHRQTSLRLVSLGELASWLFRCTPAEYIARMNTPHPIVPLESTRERTIKTLCTHFAQDHLDAAELETRLDRAHKATTLAEIEALVADLPALQATTLSPVPLVHATEVPDRRMVVAIMGGTVRRGTWTAPRQLHVLAVMGGAELDFREAQFGPGVTTVTVFATMGGVEIIVPPGLRVESDGFALMGGFEHSGGSPASPDPSAPLLRISGLAIMGGVDIQVRLPGESARDAKRRLRETRKLQRGS